MTKYTKRILSVITTGTVLLHAVAPVAFASSVTISGNGADSSSAVEVAKSNNTNVVQNNEAVVTNTVKVNSSTGGNDANKNTGGTVAVNSGDADAKATVSNTLNQNKADVKCCAQEDLTLKIAGNGADSENQVGAALSNNTGVYQANSAAVQNKVDADASTGRNDADKNTGGNVQVTSGDATTRVGVSTTANSNEAKVGGSTGAQGSISALIEGNGADSENAVGLELGKSVYVTQGNDARVSNMVKADASTGKNDADKNTNGTIRVVSGDALTVVGVDNTLNSNWAKVDCCANSDVSAKVVGNGAESENEIGLDLSNVQYINQGYPYQSCYSEICGEMMGGFGGNVADVANLVDAGAYTGHNGADKNTGDEVHVTSGDADVLAGIDNTLNFNWADLSCCTTELEAKIAENGAESENGISVAENGDKGTWQNNLARLVNGMDADALTGSNNVDENTGSYTGDPSVSSGDSSTVATVSNNMNANQQGATTMPQVQFVWNMGNWSAFWGFFVSQWSN